MINKIFKRIFNRYSYIFNFLFYLRYLFLIFFISTLIFLLVPKFINYSEKIDYIRKRTKDFEAKEQRKPKVFIAKLGQDGHDRGQKVGASALVDMGFDIEVGSLFQTPSEVAELVLKTESDIVAASSLAAGHLTLVPQLKDELNIRGLENIHIVVGGVIPKDDFSPLLDSGASAIFATGTNIVDAAAELLNILEIK